MKEKKQLLGVLGVIALLLVCVGTTYAFFTYTRTGTTSSTIQTTEGEISFVYSEDKAGVLLENAVPMTVEQGKALLDTYDFSITANMTTNAEILYQIRLVNTTAPEGEMRAIPSSHIRLYLTDGQDNPLLSSEQTPTADSDGTILMNNVITSGNEGILYTDTLETTPETPEATKTFKIRAWIDRSAGTIIDATDNGTGTITSGDNYTTDGEKVTSTESNKTYSFKVKVTANAVSK